MTFSDNRLRVGGDQDFSFRASLEWQVLKADCKFQAIRATKAVFSVSPDYEVTVSQTQGYVLPLGSVSGLGYLSPEIMNMEKRRGHKVFRVSESSKEPN